MAKLTGLIFEIKELSELPLLVDFTFKKKRHKGEIIHDGNGVFFLHNIEDLRGADPESRFMKGYKYGWFTGGTWHQSHTLPFSEDVNYLKMTSLKSKFRLALRIKKRVSV
jgi:hypothetical protein